MHSSLRLHCQARCDHHPCRQCSLCGLKMEAVTHALRWIASRGNSQTTNVTILTDLMRLLQTVNKWMYCPGHTEVNGNDRAERLACKATLTSGLRLGRSEVLRSLRLYLRAQSQRHHTNDPLEERGVERGSARRSSLKGRETAIVNQTIIGTVSKATLWKLLRDGVERIMCFSERMDYPHGLN